MNIKPPVDEQVEIILEGQQLKKIITLEEIRKYLLKKLREKVSNSNLSQSSYGYDVYLPHYMQSFSEEMISQKEPGSVERLMHRISPLFMSAAWEFSTRGIIRPGTNEYQAQSTKEGDAGSGFSFTPYGRKWLLETGHDDYIPTSPDAFVKLITGYQKDFGSIFVQRSDEAIRCYGAHAYYACCAMTGAAAECIILKLAIDRIKDEKKVRDDYQGRNGTSKTLSTLTHGHSKEIVNMLTNAFDLLKYWRDGASHATQVEISPDEAFTSLALLIRFARFSKEKYSEIISKS